MMAGFHRLLGPQRKAYLQLCRTGSLDSLVAFCAIFLVPDSDGTEPSLDPTRCHTQFRIGWAN